MIWTSFPIDLRVFLGHLSNTRDFLLQFQVLRNFHSDIFSTFLINSFNQLLSYIGGSLIMVGNEI